MALQVSSSLGCPAGACDICNAIQVQERNIKKKNKKAEHEQNLGDRISPPAGRHRGLHDGFIVNFLFWFARTTFWVLPIYKAPPSFPRDHFPTCPSGTRHKLCNNNRQCLSYFVCVCASRSWTLRDCESETPVTRKETPTRRVYIMKLPPPLYRVLSRWEIWPIHQRTSLSLSRLSLPSSSSSSSSILLCSPTITLQKSMDQSTQVKQQS